MPAEATTKEEFIANPEVRRLVGLVRDPNTPEDIRADARSSLKQMGHAGARKKREIAREAAAYRRASNGDD